MIPDDDNAHEHVLSVNKLLEQQYQIFQQTGIHELDDVVVEVLVTIVTVIQVHENHDAMEVQVADELVEMHVQIDNMHVADAQQVDSMVELDEKVDGEHILVDEVDDEVVDDEDSVTVETDEIDENILIHDIVVETDDIDEMLVIGELVEMVEIEQTEHIVDEKVETDILVEMVEVHGVCDEMVDVELFKVELVEIQQTFVDGKVEMVELQ